MAIPFGVAATSGDIGDKQMRHNGKPGRTILLMFYPERERYIEVVRHAIAVNGSYFNTHRMLQHYVLSACFR